jgi:hypothetical protein
MKIFVLKYYFDKLINILINFKLKLLKFPKNQPVKYNLKFLLKYSNNLKALYLLLNTLQQAKNRFIYLINFKKK